MGRNYGICNTEIGENIPWVIKEQQHANEITVTLWLR